jgi:hypothetical protein
VVFLVRWTLDNLRVLLLRGKTETLFQVLEKISKVGAKKYDFNLGFSNGNVLEINYPGF